MRNSFHAMLVGLNVEIKLRVCFSVVVATWLLFFMSVFMPVSGDLILYKKTNYWVYLYMGGLALCLAAFFYTRDSISKHRSKFKLMLSLAQVLSFLGVVWAYVSMLLAVHVAMNSIEELKFYMLHYATSSTLFGVVIYHVCRLYMGWVSFIYYCASILIFLYSSYIVFMIN